MSSSQAILHSKKASRCSGISCLWAVLRAYNYRALGCLLIIGAKPPPGELCLEATLMSNVLTFIKPASFPELICPIKKMTIPTFHIKYCITITFFWITTRIFHCEPICSTILQSNNINTLLHCV